MTRLLYQTGESQTLCENGRHVLVTNDGAEHPQGRCDCTPRELWLLPDQTVGL